MKIFNKFNERRNMPDIEVKDLDFIRLIKRINEKSKQAPNREEISSMVKLALEKQRKENGDSLRKSEFQFDDEIKPSNMRSLIMKSSKDENIKRLQSLSDDIYLVSVLLKRDPKEVSLYKRFQKEVATDKVS